MGDRGKRTVIRENIYTFRFYKLRLYNPGRSTQVPTERQFLAVLTPFIELS